MQTAEWLVTDIMLAGRQGKIEIQRLLTMISTQCCLALLEVQFLESEVSLHDAGGLDPSSQHILLGGDVICFSYPLQVIQVTETKAETETKTKKMISVIFNLQNKRVKTKRPTHEHKGLLVHLWHINPNVHGKYAFY